MKISRALENRTVPEQRKYGKQRSDVEPEIKVLRSFAELEAVREIWASWKVRRDADIDFCHECMWTGKEFIRPHIIVIYREGQPEAMLVGRLEEIRFRCKLGYTPLPGPRIRQLTFAGVVLGRASEENGREFINSIMGALKGREAEAALVHQCEMGAAIYHMALRAPRIGSRDHLARPLPHDILTLTENTDQMYSRFSTGLKSDLRRKKRRMLRDFGDSVKIRKVCDKSELDLAILQIEKIAQTSYQRRLGVGFRDTEEMRRRMRFYAEKGWLRLYILSLSGKPCAFWLGTLYEGNCCSDYLAFDPEFRKYSPGTYLLMTIIEDLCAAGIREIDFGLGGGTYKKRLADLKLFGSSIYIFAPTTKGVGLNLQHCITGMLNIVLRSILAKINLPSKFKSSLRGWATLRSMGTERRLANL
jgi:Acetyltransferase (GNAT) domain